ncbi:DUF5017 domain-containing protein [Bacteroides sp. OttesenSCG-928-J23]|nr:DUF5017 domain-containing protein [Bacteroides sp. OttesenSCG-928-J23]MDL2304783.1 DUF5017 domain-containing protein [Bacteroides sp. OttesenSCG-928-D19]
MNKKILAPLAALLLLAGCDYNEDNFEGFEDASKPSDIKKIEYTLTDADYKAIADNGENKSLATANGESSDLSKLTANKYFTDVITAKEYAPAFIASKWYTADDKSSIRLTYNKRLPVPEYLSPLGSAENYVVSANDYATIWGDVDAAYFTPAKPFSKSAGKILTAAYPEAKEGDIKVVQYAYSITEPNTGGGTLEVKEIDEDFNYLTEGDKNKKTELEGWLNIAEKGNKFWVNNYYNGGYIQCTAYGASEDVAAWFVSPRINLSASTAPQFAFDVCLGYPNGAKLQILVSEDFNGKDVNSATWIDITGHFAFDASNERYGKMSPAGVFSMEAYKANPFYIAFKYIGDAARTTTFQIDNIQLGDKVDIITTDVVKEDFEGETITYENKQVKGTYTWTAKNFGGNNYYQFSANKSTEEQEAYFVSEKITVPALTEGVPELLFNVCVGFWNANCLSVLVSTDYAGDVETATWTDLTADFALPESPATSYGVFGPAGAAPLNVYAGKDIYVAFKYNGNGAEARSTTYQIDNIRVATLAHGPGTRAMKAASRAISGGVNELSAIYTFDGSNWAPYSNAIAVSPSDYEEMGFETFTSSNVPANYLPQFLAKNYPYAQEGMIVAVVYTFSSKQEAAEYTYQNGVWDKSATIEVVTDQFVRSGSKWNFDPSTVIVLPPVRNHEVSVLYMQTAVDWAWENIDQKILKVSKKGDGYVTSYGNNDYYSGCSAYYCNVDMRVAEARKQYAAGYEGLDDAQVLEKMKEHLIEVMGPVLSKLNPDADTVEGVDVLYTIQFGLYTGATITDCNYQMVYKVTGKGKFEYVENSLQPL